MKSNPVKKTQKRTRLGIVVSKFNDFITSKLLQGCLDELRKNGLGDKDITVVEVPGAFEIPLAALRLAGKQNIDAVIALGAVIRGETFHFELVAENAAGGCMRVALKTGKPVIFGVITTETVEQAYARSKQKGCNKGREAAQAVLDLLGSLEKI